MKYQRAAKRNTGHQIKETVDCNIENWNGSRGHGDVDEPVRLVSFPH